MQALTLFADVAGRFASLLGERTRAAAELGKPPLLIYTLLYSAIAVI
jgi:hypothetical protein